MYKFQSILFVLCGFFGLFVDACGSPYGSNSLVNGERGSSSTPTPEDVRRGKDEAEQLSLARGLQAQGKAEKALEVYHVLIEANHPESIEIHRSMAEILTGLRRFDEASSHYLSLIGDKPDDARAHFANANLLIQHLNRCKEGISEATLAKDLFGADGLEHVRDLVIAKGYDCLRNDSEALRYYMSFSEGASYAPQSEDYKHAQRRIKELKRKVNR